MRNNDPFADLIRSLEENLQRAEDDDGDAGPSFGERGGGGTGGGNAAGNPRRLLWFLLPLLVLIFFNRVIGFYTDWAWYESLDLTSVFVTRIVASLALFGVGALIFWLFLAFNVLLMRRLEPNGLAGTPVQQIAAAFQVRVTPVLLIAGAVFAFFMGLSASSNWESVLLYLNQIDFTLTDPIFNRNVSFFIFTLPVWQMARNWLMVMLVVTFLATALTSGIGWRSWYARTRVLAHLAVLAALVLLLIAWQYRLDAYQLVYSTRGAVFGAGYADRFAQLPAYNILSVVTLIAAILLVVTAFLRQGWRAIVVLLVVWIAVAILAGNVYPSFVQRFQVSPNELTLERPYIKHNIEFTRASYNLDSIDTRDYDASNRLLASTILEESETILNVRLWDYRPLLETYNQIQALRQYYAFDDIDIDRYVVDGERRQVMLAARELVPDRLSQAAQTWVNRRLIYTHGYGVAASPVSRITSDGLPEFLLQDLPPRGVIPISRPQIYFGELTNDYVIAASEQAEFDYPRGEGNVTTRFDKDAGIEMSLGMRLLFALRFADINILLNQDISSTSQLLWRRNITERINEVAPFLVYDQDPYIVISESGELFWILDAYTVSDRFPYSEPFGSINYIRNSVKVVTNAYDGTMHFYVVDEDEPIIAAYTMIFPDLFSPMAEMPADLAQHVRYPTDLFQVQSEIYLMYHMTDPDEYYNREDVWAWPEEIFESQTERMEPYYVLMQLPDEDRLEFVQILPFTPANRENMIAWMAAKSDPEQYGQILVFEFGKDELYYGPKQIEARIDQNPEISEQLALWNQQGSAVIRGNLLVIPIRGSLLYVEPLYLQATSGRIPELKRVILATADRVVMTENLGLSLVALFGENVLANAELADLATFGGEAPDAVEMLAAGQTVGGSATVDNALSVENLIDQANQQFERAQGYAQSGDWAAYGDEINALQATLSRLAELVGAVPEEAAQEVPAAVDEGSEVDDQTAANP